MSQKFRLLYLNFNPVNAVQVSKHLDGASFDFQLDRISSLQDNWNVLEKDKYDLLILDGLPEKNALNLQERVSPNISIVERAEEASAIDAMVQGFISDYVLRSKNGFKRLPLVIRAMLARKSRSSSSAKSGLEHLRPVALLKENYDVLVVVDKAGKVVFQTQDSVFWSGYSPEEIADINPFELVYKNDLETILPIFSELVSNPGGEEVARVRFLDKDETWHWLEVAGKNMLEDSLVQGILIR